MRPTERPSFVVGIYGINFWYMSEIEAEWGYLAVVIITAIVAAVMVIYFNKRWL